MKYVPSAVSRSLREIGKNLSIQHKLLNLTVEDVSQRAGVSVSTVSNAEHGKPVRTDSLLSMLNVLQMLQPMVAASDPYQTDIGQLRAVEQLPQRVRR